MSADTGAKTSMTNEGTGDALNDGCRKQFLALVEGAGIKRFATSLGISTRQINRMLTNAQPNPIERLIKCLHAVEPQLGDRVLDYICQEMGGHFVRQEGMNDAAINAVRECAEAIAAISDGQVGEVDMKEIRDAISALSGLILALRDERDQKKGPR